MSCSIVLTGYFKSLVRIYFLINFLFCVSWYVITDHDIGPGLIMVLSIIITELLISEEM